MLGQMTVMGYAHERQKPLRVFSLSYWPNLAFRMASQNANTEQGGVAPGARLFATGFRQKAGANALDQIFNSMHCLLDVGPKADVVNACFGVPNLVDVAAPDGNTPVALLYDWTVDRRGAVVVVAAGNPGNEGQRPP
jgi:hypothetical protein